MTKFLGILTYMLLCKSFMNWSYHKMLIYKLVIERLNPFESQY